MFVSIDEIEDTGRKYENETRNIRALRRCNSRLKWQQSILEEDNAKVFVNELSETLIYINHFITNIEIESATLNEATNTLEIKKEDEKKFKGYLAMGRELITKLKVLVTLEKTSAMEKYEQSHIRKLSYAATEDTTSGVDTESVIDAGRGTFSREKSLQRCDSQTITLVHKYAASFTRHYELFDKLNHDVEEIVERFNFILDVIHQQLQIIASGTGIADLLGLFHRLNKNFKDKPIADKELLSSFTVIGPINLSSWLHRIYIFTPYGKTYQYRNHRRKNDDPDERKDYLSEQ